MSKVTRNFIKYVSFNVLGMMGMSIYILSDTFFMSHALQSDGITALNFALPVYSFIYALSLMIGIGGATKYKMFKSEGKKDQANKIYSLTVWTGLIIGVFFTVLGIFFSREITILFGAKDHIIDMSNEYIKTIMIFTPAFMLNNIYQAFVRNDDNPKLPMLAMVIGSVSNILLDVVFILLLDMGMFGAAISTCLAPIISLAVISIHFIKKKNSFHFTTKFFSIKKLMTISSLGISTFITEISSGIVMLIFNILILGISGVIGVAAYGIITNISLVALIIFSGVGQGMQPLASEAKALGNKKEERKIIKMGLFTTLAFSFLIYAFSMIFIDFIIAVFNSEKNMELYEIAKIGIRIYFIGFIFASINIVLSAFYSAIAQPKKAFVISICRGVLLIIPIAFLLVPLFGMSGVWLSFVATEFIVTIIALLMKGRSRIKDKKAMRVLGKAV